MFLALSILLSYIWGGFAGPLPKELTSRALVGRDAKIMLDGPPVPMSPTGGGTYPRANKLSDDSIIGAYTNYAGGNSTITLVRSVDGGSSWSALGTAATAPSNANDVDNPYPIQLPNGRVLVGFRNHSKDPSTGAYTSYRITVSASDDNGTTWKFLSQPVLSPAGPNGVWEPFMRIAKDGNLQLFYSRENSGADQDSLMRTSTDGGVTWTNASTISGSELNDARDGMIGVAEASNGTLVAVFESTETGTFTINAVTSTDDGKNWGGRTRIYTPTGTKNNAGAPQILNVGGKLCVSFMTDEDTQLHKWISGAAAKVICSDNNGATWGGKTTVGEVQSNWPGLVDLDDGSFLYMYDHGGAKAQKIHMS